MSGGYPTVGLALPGDWTQVPLDDDRRIDALVQLVGDSAPGLRESLEDIAAVGGDTCFLELGTTTPELITIAWPSRGAPGIDALSARLSAATDAAQEVLARDDDYAAVKLDRRQIADGVWGTTYWITHPDSGSDLMIGVTSIGAEPNESRQHAIDDLARFITWVEPGAGHNA